MLHNTDSKAIQASPFIPFSRQCAYLVTATRGQTLYVTAHMIPCNVSKGRGKEGISVAGVKIVGLVL